MTASNPNKPMAIYKNPEDCLYNLSLNLTALAEKSLIFLDDLRLHGEKGELQVRPGNWPSEATKITQCLLVPSATGEVETLLLGHLAGESKNLLENFRAIVTMQLFDLVTQMYMLESVTISATKDPEKFQPVHLIALLESIALRASILANTSAFNLRLSQSGIFQRMIEMKPGAIEEYNQLRESYIDAIKQVYGTLSPKLTVLQKPHELVNQMAINIPVFVNQPIAPTARSINGMYFPEKMEKSLFDQLAQAQAQAMVQQQ
jgi:hypothetical protein